MLYNEENRITVQRLENSATQSMNTRKKKKKGSIKSLEMQKVGKKRNQENHLQRSILIFTKNNKYKEL